MVEDDGAGQHGEAGSFLHSLTSNESDINSVKVFSFPISFPYVQHDF